MGNVPAELRYSKEHEWVAQLAPNRFRIGITDYAQAALGDIVYIQLPKLGATVTAGQVCGEVESTKSVSEIYSPLSGKILAINSDLESAPERINSEPYGAGWIAEIEVESQGQIDGLLSAQEYQAITA